MFYWLSIRDNESKISAGGSVTIRAKLVFHNPQVCHTCHDARPGLLSVCKCYGVSYCSKKCAKIDKTHKEACKLLGQIAQSYSCIYLEDEYLREELGAYAVTLHCALQSLGRRRFGREHKPLEDLTVLDVHVITNRPLFFAEPWDNFMHNLPKLKQLNLVFVMQGSASKPN